MKQENIDYLNLHVHHWRTLRDDGYITNLSGEVAQQLLRIAREEWCPQYETVLHHAVNVCILMRYVYTQFEKYVAEPSAGGQEQAICEQVGDAETAEEGHEALQTINRVKMHAKPRVKGRGMPARAIACLAFSGVAAKTEYASIRPPPGFAAGVMVRAKARRRKGRKRSGVGGWLDGSREVRNFGRVAAKEEKGILLVDWLG